MFTGVTEKSLHSNSSVLAAVVLCVLYVEKIRQLQLKAISEIYVQQKILTPNLHFKDDNIM